MINSTSIKLYDGNEPNICVACGTRFKNKPEGACTICLDERQYVPASGQSWVSYDTLADKHEIRIRELVQNVLCLTMEPAFGIKQRAHLLISPEGNLLWDCLPFLDEQGISEIREKGGLRGIAISHPHFYGLMSVWAEVFDCPIYVNSLDAAWIMDDTKHVQLWDGQSLELWSGLRLVHIGGHFDGSTILQADSVGPQGTLFVGDTLQISPNRQFISVMYSYPNLIPLPVGIIQRIGDKVRPLKFDAMFGAFEWQNIRAEAKSLFELSIDKYERIFKSNSGC